MSWVGNMSELTKIQSLFAERFSELCLVAVSFGYDIAFSDGFRNKACNKAIGGHPQSLHTMRLAHDLILRDKEGNVLGEMDHERLHRIWFQMGGAAMISGDSNHYSFAWKGMR